MKKTVILILSALLLFGCADSEGISENSFSNEEYQSKAHDALENYSDAVDESVYSEGSENGTDGSVSAENETDSSETESASSESEIDAPSGDSSDTSDKPADVTIPEILLITADIAYEDETAATLVCGRDGSIDLYFANGYEMRGMGEKSDCREMSQKLFDACEKYFSEFEKVTELPFPDSKTTYVYLKTTNGYYRIAYDNTQILLGPEGDIEICVKNAITNITKYAPE